MPSHRWAVFLLLATRLACADEAPATQIDQFLVAHEKVEVAPGRNLNLFCIGSGKVTVLFDAGGSDWSIVWALVQPIVAREARACSYDRAGLGYSDPARGARSPVAVVEDLHALIHAAKIGGPLILVGHSLGGFHTKLHAALYPHDVAGIVLVEPSEERAWERTRANVRARFGLRDATRAELLDQDFLARLMDRYRNCAEIARAGALDAASDGYRQCSDPPRPALGEAAAAERRRLQVTVAYQQAQASEIIHSIYGSNAGDALYADLLRRGALGSLPLVLLTRAAEPAENTLDAIDVFQTSELQAQTVALSRNGSHRTVTGSSHHIELDVPQAVVDAIHEVMSALK